MSAEPRPFIPAWLDDAGLSPAEMRTFIHLLRSADNATGVAWPSYQRMVEVTGMSRATIARCVEALEDRKLLEKVGKPFGGSCRYRVLPNSLIAEHIERPPTVSPETLLAANSLTTDTIEAPPTVSPETLLAANSLTTDTIEAPPIVSPENCNMQRDETPIVSPESKEGNPKKVLQRRVSNKELFNDDDLLPFQSPEFRSAWNEWKQHRKEKRKPITPLSARKSLMDLATMGEARAIAAIQHSIASGYQGIFEPTNGSGGKLFPNRPGTIPPMSLEDAAKLLGGRAAGLTGHRGDKQAREYPEPPHQPLPRA